MYLDKVTLFCFAASYTVALGLEIWHQVRPRRIFRLVGLVFGGAGLLAHTLFVASQDLPLASPQGSLLFLAWILAIFYLYGSIHHARLAWGLFVLPLVLGLSMLAALYPSASGMRDNEGFFSFLADFKGEKFWGMIHGVLVLFAAVGVSVAFVASVMYLVQVHRLKAKLAPGHGVKLLSLERLEEMNRRAILTAFPLLTAGLLVGIALQWQTGAFLEGFSSPKILSIVGLWLVFAILLYLRYAVHARGKQMALLNMLAFALLLLALAYDH